MKVVERKGFVARVAPPRPAFEGESPPVVGTEEAPAFPGLEFEEVIGMGRDPISLVSELMAGMDKLAVGNAVGGVMMGPMVTFEGVEQPAPRPTATTHDEHEHLPDHVREEILAGRKAMGQHEAKHDLEMSLGAKLSAQNHARTRPAPIAETPKVSRGDLGMYGDGDRKFGRGNVTSTVTQKGNYNEGGEE